MTYVVTESCIRCKYTDCVDVCPVDCFREGPNFLVIDPDECIDCTLCVAECPVEAIFAEDDVPPAQQPFTALNAELAKLWKPIIERKPAPADADEWKDVKDKLKYLERYAMTLAHAGLLESRTFSAPAGPRHFGDRGARRLQDLANISRPPIG